MLWGYWREGLFGVVFLFGVALKSTLSKLKYLAGVRVIGDLVFRDVMEMIM